MYKKIFWQDHVTEFDNRFREQNNTDGTISHIPVEGEVIQQGTPQNAANFNNMENGIFENSELSAIIVQEVINIKNVINEKDNNAGEIAESAKEIANSANLTAEEALEKAENAIAKADKALLASQNAQDAADAALSALAKQTKIINALPTQNGTLTYSGEELSPKWNSYDDTKLTIGGDTTATNAGTYTATFTPKDGYMWNDETTEAKFVNWAINRASIAVPSQNGSLAYTGSAQSPTWSGYDSDKMTVSGTTSGVNVSNYTAIFTPKDNYQWSDGTISDKIVTWSIDKAAGSLSLSKTNVTLDASALTTTVSVSRTGDGTITAISGNTGIATVSVSGTTLTITAKAKGTATITVSVAATTNHTTPTSKTIRVTVALPSTTLNDNTPAQIQEAAKAGIAPNYWSVGDRIGIKFDSAVGCILLSGTYYAYIIGFNHNSNIEGNNSIHFQFGQTQSWISIAFTDDTYDKQCAVTDSTAAFVMNTTRTNSCGWENSYMRKKICNGFFNAMPSNWRSVISSCTKYSNNSGVTATVDKIWLLSEFEVFGKTTFANIAEETYQKQYEYYKNGNDKIKYKYNAVNTYCYWWLRSAQTTQYNTENFCAVSYLGSSANLHSDCSYGFAPCFAVA